MIALLRLNNFCPLFQQAEQFLGFVRQVFEQFPLSVVSKTRRQPCPPTRTPPARRVYAWPYMSFLSFRSLCFSLVIFRFANQPSIVIGRYTFSTVFPYLSIATGHYHVFLNTFSRTLSPLYPLRLVAIT